MRTCLLFVGFWITLIAHPIHAQDTLRVMHYNLLYYGNTWGCTEVTNNTNLKDGYLKTTIKYTMPDVLTVNEIGDQDTLADRILNNVLNTNGITYYQRAVKTNVSPPSPIVNMLYYNSNKLTLYSQEQVKTNLLGGNLVRLVDLYKMYYNDTNPLTNQDTVFITFIAAHLHSSNPAKREDATEALMDLLDQKGAPANYLFGGDFNIDSSSETAFQFLINHPNASIRFRDPINQLGNWHNNNSYSNIHTQSTRASNTNGGCFNSGGMDDRFDMILASNYLMNAMDAVQFIPGSYKAFGQDGTAFNQALPFAGNTSVPDSIATALYEMSDHLPVLLDLRIIPGYSGIESSNDDGLNILFNNPVTDQLNITITGLQSEALAIDIYDITGRVVRKFTFQNAGQGAISIPINSLAPGLYVMKIAADGTAPEVFKIVKQ